MEIYKDVLGLEEGYLISNYGNLKSKEIIVDYGNIKALRPSKVLNFRKCNNGYLYTNISINKKRQTVKSHRLVAIAFIPNIENKPNVNHINGIKTDNRVENLEWCTAQENSIHAVKIGLKKGVRGVKSHLSKLNEIQVMLIRENKDKLKNKELSLIYKVSVSQINRIMNNVNWKIFETTSNPNP